MLGPGRTRNDQRRSLIKQPDRCGRHFRLAAAHGDASGAGALEFALIAPIAMLLYAGVATISEAVMVQQRTSHMASAVGDLVAQQPSMNAGYVTNAMAAGAQIMMPMRSKYNQRITSVVVKTVGSANVAWSCANGTYTAMTGSVTVPSGVVNTLNVGDSVILSEANSTFSSPMTYKVLPSGFTYQYSFWLKPRYGSAIPAPSSC